jgi:YHS domain-containing protein
MKLFYTLTIIAIQLIRTGAYAQTDPVSNDGVAIGGYDVVSYFKLNKAVKGSGDFQYKFNDVLYYFSDEQNKKDFIAAPIKYMPQYDGYCALAIGAQRKKVSIDPNTFKVKDGKLYLFFNGKLAFSGRTFNSIEPWNKDEDILIKKSEKNWPEVKNQKYSNKAK